jgi:hypothetical protein
MKVSCPQCRSEIPLDDLNVSTDIALCRRCSKQFSLAELTRESSVQAVDLTRPPKGTWLKQVGGGFELGATTRSGVAFFLVPFTLFWSGGSLAGIYGSQLVKGQFDWKLSLFGLPFLLGSCFLIPLAATSALGKLVVRAEGFRGSVFIGVGSIGWTRRFRWDEITGVRMSLTKWQQNNRHLPVIELTRDTKPVRFGSQLTEQRRNFMLAALRQILAVRPQ